MSTESPQDPPPQGSLVPNPSRVRYFVASGHGGGWLIFREGRSRAVHRLPQKFIAVETARTMARQDAPSEVMVELRNGCFHLLFAFAAGGLPIAL